MCLQVGFTPFTGGNYKMIVLTVQFAYNIATMSSYIYNICYSYTIGMKGFA